MSDENIKQNHVQNIKNALEMIRSLPDDNFLNESVIDFAASILERLDKIETQLNINQASKQECAGCKYYRNLLGTLYHALNASTTSIYRGLKEYGNDE